MRSILRWNRLTNDQSRSARSSSRRVPVSMALKASTMASSWPLDGVGLGQRARIGLVLAGAVAVERELVEQMRGRRGGVMFAIGVGVGEGEGAVVA